MRGGAYANQRLTSVADGKGSPMKGQDFQPDLGNSAVRHDRGLEKRGHGGIVIPPRNRKGEPGNLAYSARVRVLSQPQFCQLGPTAREIS